MDEKYLNNLYNWIASVDGTFTERYTPEDWVNKLSTDTEYPDKLYDWMSKVDPTFSERHKKEDWLTKVGAGKGGIKKSEIGGVYYQQQQEQIIETEKSLAEEDPDSYIKQNEDLVEKTARDLNDFISSGNKDISKFWDLNLEKQSKNQILPWGHQPTQHTDAEKKLIEKYAEEQRNLKAYDSYVVKETTGEAKQLGLTEETGFDAEEWGNVNDKLLGDIIYDGKDSGLNLIEEIVKKEGFNADRLKELRSMTRHELYKISSELGTYIKNPAEEYLDEIKGEYWDIKDDEVSVVYGYNNTNWMTKKKVVMDDPLRGTSYKNIPSDKFKEIFGEDATMDDVNRIKGLASKLEKYKELERKYEVEEFKPSHEKKKEEFDKNLEKITNNKIIKTNNDAKEGILNAHDFYYDIEDLNSNFNVVEENGEIVSIRGIKRGENGFDLGLIAYNIAKQNLINKQAEEEDITKRTWKNINRAKVEKYVESLPLAAETNQLDLSKSQLALLFKDSESIVEAILEFEYRKNENPNVKKYFLMLIFLKLKRVSILIY